MLVHHADAARQGGLGRSGRQALAERLDAALVGHIMAEQDIHQRGLAGAVFAQQPQNFAALQIEADRIIGDERAEALGDAVQPEDDLALAVMSSCRPWGRSGGCTLPSRMAPPDPTFLRLGME